MRPRLDHERGRLTFVPKVLRESFKDFWEKKWHDFVQRSDRESLEKYKWKQWNTLHTHEDGYNKTDR